MAARLSAFVIWALVAAGTVFWGYRFWGSAVPLPANVQVVREEPAARADLTRLLGAAPAAAVESVAAAPVAESSRFRLVGVLAPKAAGAGDRTGSGVALIAVDGRAPRAYVVGSRVDGDLLLTAVSHRSASLGTDGDTPGLVLELPALAPPATGVLPRAVPGADAGRPMPPPAAPGVAPGAPGSPQRSPTQQAQAAVGANADEEDDDEAPAPPPAAQRPRVGGPLTR